jgi:hypothetical protein
MTLMAEGERGVPNLMMTLSEKISACATQKSAAIIAPRAPLAAACPVGLSHV